MYKTLLLCTLFAVSIIPKTVSAQEVHPVIARITHYSALYGADTLLAVNIAYAESNFKADARSASSTATGIFQFTKATWLENCTRDFKEAYNAELNIECGARLIARKQFYRWETSAHMNGRGWLFLPANKAFNWSPNG